MSESKFHVYIFTDGACSGNPGPGGWGVVMKCGGYTKELSGYNPHTTNNQMELQSTIEALRALKTRCRVTITTDSQYVKNGITTWINSWQKNGWRTSQRKDVKNKELWQSLLAETQKHEVDWQWVKGHAGHPENERADYLATNEIEKNR